MIDVATVLWIFVALVNLLLAIRLVTRELTESGVVFISIHALLCLLGVCRVISILLAA